MKLIIIAAVSVDGVIGIGDEMPWRIPEDFKHYRETTMGHTLICGSKTFKSLPQKAHEGRKFIILSSKYDDSLDKLKYSQFTNVDNMLKSIEHWDKDVYVIGGESVYEQLIDYCDEAVITWVNKMYSNGDKKFPITKLFANFEMLGDESWVKSTSDISFKITYYRKI